MGVSFGWGLYSGARRTAVFEVARDVRNRLQYVASDQSAAPARAKPAAFTPLYDTAAIAQAQKTNAAPPQFMEWAGFYRMATRPQDLDGLEPLNPWLPTVLHQRLQPWARARIETTDGIADDTGQVCQPTGWFRATGEYGAFLWLPGRQKIVMAYGDIETHGVQRIYLNRTHPPHLLPTWNGDSVGYWDGDALVVHTVGFNDKSWLHSTMEPHTEETRAIQRIRPVRNGAFLEIHYVVEDRKALTSAYSYTRYFKKVGESMPESVCNDDVQIWRDYRRDALDRQFERARMVNH
jgi:hypothetical protein